MAKTRLQDHDDEGSLFEQPTPLDGASVAPPSPDDAPSAASRAASASVKPAAGDAGVSLHEVAQEKYLNYALSVITSRALPDVRDGLKPVQRRILFTMWQQGLTHQVKHRKCAKVVGDVMGNYHPHGDTAIYDTLVRMAQPFSLRYPLIDGSGNFGSLDGDAAAAMRYTECRLAAVSDQMLLELEQQTVAFRPNYDGTKFEPVVLPARLPNLLVNGSSGIAVGMATNIPPHHLGEVCTAAEKLLDALIKDEELTSRQLCRWVKGPDFPTGGQIVSSQQEIKQVYETGQGSIKVRGTWTDNLPTEHKSRSSKVIFITSVPYGTNKSELVEQIAQVVLSRKLPPLLDVRDLSTSDVRIELVLKKDADEAMVMAYLFKHTNLQTNFAANLTCLVPTENPQVGRPERLDLKSILWHFLHFRLEVVTKRLEHELGALKKRIHVLEGFEKVFDALDEIIRLIRQSEGKADAAQKIMARFKLDEEQTDAILELKLYRLAKLEILIIQKELQEKRKRVRQIEALLKDEDGRWEIVRGELQEVVRTHGDKRRTEITSVEHEPEYSAEDFIIEEDNVVLLTRDGWVKRQKEAGDVSRTRLREGDGVLSVIAGSTRSSVVFLSNYGTAYTCRLVDIPASTGYGEPIQKLFKLKDGEKIVLGLSLDPRTLKGEIKSPGLDKDGAPIPAEKHALAITSDGYALRFGLEGFVDPSTRSGRRFARPAEGSQVVGVWLVDGSEVIIAATKQAHAILCRIDQINHLAGPGKGVILIKLQEEDDQLLGGIVVQENERTQLKVETSLGGQQSISTAKYEISGRGGRGREIIKRGQFVRIIWQETETAASPSAEPSSRE